MKPPRAILPACVRGHASGRASWWLFLLLIPLALVPLILFGLPGERETRRGTLPDETETSLDASRDERTGTTSRGNVRRSEEPSGSGTGGASTSLADSVSTHPDDAPLVEFPCGITGRVLDEDGDPIEGASVQAFQDIPRVWFGETTTDASGSFQLDRLPMDESVNVYVSDGRHAPAIIDDVQIVSGLLVPLGRIILMRGAKVSGIVASAADDKPVARARVSVAAWVEGYALQLPDLETSTDAQGRFMLQPLPAGSCRLVVDAAGYALTWSNPFALGAGTTGEDMHISLAAARNVAGRVQDGEGRPIAGALVEMAPADARGIESNRAARTNASGDFLIEIDPARTTYQVVCAHPDYLRYQKAWETSEKELVVTLEGGGMIEVRLGGVPAGKSESMKWYVERGGRGVTPTAPSSFQLLAEDFTDFRPGRFGQFVSEAVYPGWYRVRVVIDDRWSGISTPVAVSHEAPLQKVGIELDESFRLSGIVRNGRGEPIASALVTLRMGHASTQTRTGEDGAFRTCAFGGEGHSIILIEKEGFAPLEEYLSLGRDALTKEFTLIGGGRIHGRVSIADEAPGRSLTIWLRASGLDLERSTLSDGAGNYEFTGLAIEETYNLYPIVHQDPKRTSISTFRHPVDDDDRFTWNEDYEFEVDLTEETPEVRLDLRLPKEPRATLKGVVRDDGGPRVGVTLVASEFETNFESRCTTGPDGGFSFSVPAGEVDLDVLSNVGEQILWTSTMEIEEGDEEYVEIYLRTASIRGIVNSPDGAPLPGASVKAVFRGGHEDDDFAPSAFARQVRTDARGTFELADVIAGTYRIEAWSTAFARAHQEPIEVSTGGTADVRLQLATPAPLELELTDREGKPLERSFLECFDSSGEIVPLHNSGRARILRGQVRIDNLPAGTFRFVVRSGRERDERTIQLVEGTVNRHTWQAPFLEPVPVPGRSK